MVVTKGWNLTMLGQTGSKIITIVRERSQTRVWCNTKGFWIRIPRSRRVKFWSPACLAWPMIRGSLSRRSRLLLSSLDKTRGVLRGDSLPWFLMEGTPQRLTPCWKHVRNLLSRVTVGVGSASIWSKGLRTFWDLLAPLIGRVGFSCWNLLSRV